MNNEKNEIDDFAFWGAKKLVTALSEGVVTSEALLEIYISRIERLNPSVNAVVAYDFEQARQRAREADAATRQGQSWGPLHGLPITIKDTYEVPNMPCAAGTPEYQNHIPMQSAHAVQKLLDAGAIVFAKTNVPYKALDIQTYNSVYGVSNNPWDLARTTGGSSGGAAAALACGFTALELGSDIGGSIRLPAHFCGVYGHKPTHGIISMQGHIPGPPGHLAEPDLAVAGPMARTAEDLGFMLDLITGPSLLDSPGWQLTLPPATQKQLSDFRVLLWVDDPHFPIDQHMTKAYQSLSEKLQAEGVKVTTGSPLGIGLTDIYQLYFLQMGTMMKAWLTRQERKERGMLTPFGGMTATFVRNIKKWVDLPASIDCFIEGLTMSHGAWLEVIEESLQLRERFIKVFSDYDVILAPPTLTTAFAHNHERLTTRKIDINGESRHYADLFAWISPATLMGLPATSAPLGFSPDELPINVQIIGGPFQDKTTIKFAELLAHLYGGFKKPSIAS
ncbi:MAG: amidase [Moraxellaceae bacterium]|nr:amidase [Moraxellaceae bacterium]MDZ4386129.1 amidase [Moraxellaceae bacterium]